MKLSALRTVAAATIVASLAVPAFAQGKPGQLGEDRTLIAADSWPIKITYFESTGGKEAPVVILLPAAEGENSMTRKVWNSMAASLNKRGYAVVTADLRKHGDSADPNDRRGGRLSPNDYALMASLDMEAIKTFLVEEHQKQKLNIRKLGIAAAGSSCMVASAFTVLDWSKKPWPDAPVFDLRTPKGQDVRALLMLSPKSNVKGINSTDVMKFIADPYKGIAVQIYYDKSDRAEKSSAEKLYGFLELKTRGGQTEPKPSDEEGTDQSVGIDFSDARQLRDRPAGKEFAAEGLLAAKDASGKIPMEQYAAEFFDKYVNGRSDTWKTRTSKLE